MKVLFVCNNAYMKGNGLCTAVVALRTRLIHSGIDVRIFACENPEYTSAGRRVMSLIPVEEIDKKF